MSALTKVFVVLLVIVSLLQTAGTVVFVNKIAPMQAALTAANSAKANADNQATAANQLAASLQVQLDKSTAARTNADQMNQTAIATVETEKSELTTANGKLAADNTALQIAAEKAAQDLNWMSKAFTDATADVTKLRASNDGLVKRQEEDSRTIADLTNRVDTMTVEFHNTQEQLQLAQDNIQKYRAALMSANIDPDKVIGPGVVPTGPGAPPIGGHVKETKVINGATYITIDVGSADNVLKGMRFSVLDNQGNFLCFADIETVDNNDSIGKLDGQADKITQVQAGDNVKTQIRGS